ncbi:hypothetical protein DRQ16_03120 [bacterium]|nr:MAG: hypothetical protein DRQ16_03120 [bacterium]
MEQTLAFQVATKLGVDVLEVVREYYEVLLLRGLSRLPWGGSIVFKGGTCLRLVYGSPRFSQDLSFSLLEEIEGFGEGIEKVVAPFPECEIEDIWRKRFTYLAEIKITRDYLPHPFRIKIEISRRIEEGYEWKTALVSSPCSVYSVVMKVATLRQLYRDKIECLKKRGKARDLFDLWFISQKLGLPYEPPVRMDRKILRRDLRRYLPPEFHRVIEEL